MLDVAHEYEKEINQHIFILPRATNFALVMDALEVALPIASSSSLAMRNL